MYVHLLTEKLYEKDSRAGRFKVGRYASFHYTYQEIYPEVRTIVVSWKRRRNK